MYCGTISKFQFFSLENYTFSDLGFVLRIPCFFISVMLCMIVGNNALRIFTLLLWILRTAGLSLKHMYASGLTCIRLKLRVEKCGRGPPLRKVAFCDVFSPA